MYVSAHNVSAGEQISNKENCFLVKIIKFITSTQSSSNTFSSDVYIEKH